MLKMASVHDLTQERYFGLFASPSIYTSFSFLNQLWILFVHYNFQTSHYKMSLGLQKRLRQRRQYGSTSLFGEI